MWKTILCFGLLLFLFCGTSVANNDDDYHSLLVGKWESKLSRVDQGYVRDEVSMFFEDGSYLKEVMMVATCNMTFNCQGGSMIHLHEGDYFRANIRGEWIVIAGTLTYTVRESNFPQVFPVGRSRQLEILYLGEKSGMLKTEDKRGFRIFRMESGIDSNTRWIGNFTTLE